MKTLRLLPIFLLMFSCFVNGREIPNWFTNPPMDSNAIFVSATESAANSPHAIDQALDNAKRALNGVLGRSFESWVTQFLNQTSSSNDQKIKQEVRDVASRIYYDGAVSTEETEVFQEKNRYRAFVLIKYSVNQAQKDVIASIYKNKILLNALKESSAFLEMSRKVGLQLPGDLNKAEETKSQREQAKKSPRINLQVSATKPSNDGSYTISIQTNTDTASLKLNGEELGGKADGIYAVTRVARAGQETRVEVIATDVYGNIDAKTLTVSRAVIESKVAYAALNPARIKRQAERDAVAIIIGVADYRNLPRAAHADDDARAFYDYAIRALGVKAENIKLLVNQDAGEIEIYKAFKTWLPSRVRAATDVYVFYSGHGYTTPDGKGLYWFPHQADRDLISKTAILVEELNADILAAKPKSVTIFADACYSGQVRSGETLIASARPIVPKIETRLFPEAFTVITASQYDQISSSSPDLHHGIFSYYLMRGIEGEADTNRDGKITLGEMKSYLIENVGRQAAAMSRKQEPQLIGDMNQILVGR
jgi:hypothetical protein